MCYISHYISLLIVLQEYRLNKNECIYTWIVQISDSQIRLVAVSGSCEKDLGQFIDIKVINIVRI